MNSYSNSRRRRFLSLCLLSFILLVTTAQANDSLDFDLSDDFAVEETESPYFIGGYAETRTQLGIQNAELFSFRNRLHLEFSAQKNAFSFFSDGNLDFDPAVSDWTDQNWEQAHAELGKCTLALDTKHLDITAGQHIVRWGTGDGINPMDLFNPVDQRDPIANARSLARRPVPLLQAVLQTPPFTLEGVFLPYAAVNSPFLSDSPWESLSLKTLRQSAAEGTIHLDDESTPHGTELGLRAQITAYGWDAALLYFEGYANDAVYARSEHDGMATYEARHPKFKAYGVTFAKGLSKGTVRGELALKPETVIPTSPGSSSKSGLTEADLFQGVIGIDWTYLTDLYVNTQYFLEAITNKEQDHVCRPYTDGFTFKISNKFKDDALEAGVQGTVYLSGDGFSIEPYAQYDIDDHWKLTAGFVFWDGSANSRLGQYRENDMLYLKIKYAF